MRIVHVAAEHAELAQAGGLGDVIESLPTALAATGADVSLLLPGYPGAIETLGGELLEGPTVHMPWGPARFRVHRATLDGVRVELLDEPAWFGRPHLYGRPGEGYSDNPVRFAAFCRAARTWLDTAYGDSVDVVHSHDWHTGLLPATYEGRPGRPLQVFTVHNVAYQGTMPLSALPVTGLSDALLGIDGVVHEGEINCLKAGVQLADVVTTVSPTYARELLTDDGGWDLAPLFRWRQPDLFGIVNGVRTTVAPPDPDERPSRRAALCAEVALESPSGPLLAMVSRLTAQKGIDLWLEALRAALTAGSAAVLVGTGDPGIALAARRLEAEHPGRFVFIEAFDRALAARVFAGADVVCVPSRFEPCGLVQLHAMRAGALPLVRRTGGLADTVTDVDAGGWGFVFEDATVSGLSEALGRAAALYDDRPAWRAAVDRAMTEPVGWETSAARYLELYEARLAAQA